jgi:spore coat polysaccharide biosynthesis predicted glycosyltransferase SpsG
MTKYEAAYLGVPIAILSQTEDQAAESVQFSSRGLGEDLGLSATLGNVALSQRLANWIADRGRRESLSRTALTFFPEDPTRNAAECFARLLTETLL